MEGGYLDLEAIRGWKGGYLDLEATGNQGEERMNILWHFMLATEGILFLFYYMDLNIYVSNIYAYVFVSNKSKSEYLIQILDLPYL